MSTNLTEQEVKAIADKAQAYIIKLQTSTASIDRRRDFDRRNGYIAGATEYALTAKALAEALEEMLKTIKRASYGYHVHGLEYAEKALSNYKSKNKKI